MHFPLILFPLLSLCLFAHPHDHGKMILLKGFADDSNGKVMVMTRNEGDGNGYTCEVFTESKLIERFSKHSRNMVVWRPNPDKMRFILKNCVNFSIDRQSKFRSNQEDEEDDFILFDEEDDVILSDEEDDIVIIEDGDDGILTDEDGDVIGFDYMEAGIELGSINITIPGTKWCGPGDTADDYDDLGKFDDTDKCCRTHDNCNDILLPGESKGNVTNETSYTLLNCKCDEDFYACLEEVDSFPANAVGFNYFTVMGSSCYRYDYPPTDECKEWKSSLKARCLEYYKDYSKPKDWQMSTVKNY